MNRFILRFSILILVLFQSICLMGQGVGGGRSMPGSQRSSNGDTVTLKSAKRQGSIFLNDSSRNVYGPNTTKYSTAYEIFINRPNYRPIDTSIVNYHRWTYPQRFNQSLIDLGNVGTALYSIYPEIRTFSGNVSGFDVYSRYFNTEEPLFFDTKSPYTRIQLVWGGNGRAMSRIEFKRNINSRWNFGFNYRPILVDKQIDKKRKGDRHVTSQYYDLHSSYVSKNEQYQIFGSYRRMRQRVYENGGIYIGPTGSYGDYFATDASPALFAAETGEIRHELNLYHRFKLASALEVYQDIKLGNQKNLFTDKYSSTNNLVPFDNWERVKADSLNASDEINFKYFQQEAGFKGRKGFLFYNAYYKFRKFNTEYNYISNDTLGIQNYGIEHYTGGRLVVDIDSLSRLNANFEINQRGNYSLNAQFSSKWFEGTFTQSIAAPGSFYKIYRGAHDYWVNDFKNTVGLQTEAFLKLPLKRFSFAPGLGYSLFSNYIFLKDNPIAVGQRVLPSQSSGVQSILRPQVKLSMQLLKRFEINVGAINSILTANASDAIQIPDWIFTGQLAYKGWLFNKNLEAQIGIDFSWRSAWFAPGYDVATQHYYVQTLEKVDPWLLTDFFINGRIKRGRFFYKVHNLLQAGGKPGYLVIPGYPGQKTIMDFGFELILFD